MFLIAEQQACVQRLSPVRSRRQINSIILMLPQFLPEVNRDGAYIASLFDIFNDPDYLHQ
jgi:hypothetical protein